MKPDRKEKERHTLRKFVAVFCHEKHNGAEGNLCEECTDLLRYAEERLDKCPLDPKPKCKDCPVHCYNAEYRGRIREVMKFSGMYFVRHGRVDWLVRYFMS